MKIASEIASQKGVLSGDDGTPLFYEVFGNGPALILCNGLLCQRAHWRHQIDYFAKKYRVVTFDYRGHGASGFPPNDHHLTLSWCARDALAVARALDLSKVVLLGHSMGVPVAARAAVLDPTRVAAVVLVCGTVTNPFESMFYSNRMQYWYRLSESAFETAPGAVSFLWKRLTSRSRLSYFLTSHLGFNPNLAEERDVWTYLDGVHENRLDTFYRLLRDYSQSTNIEWLRSVQCPALMIAGNEDYVTPIHLMEAMKAVLPRSELELIPTGSHNAHADLPRVVNLRIERFLTEVGFQ